MNAMKYAERLACESKWSHATYRYLKAAFIIQFMDDEQRAGVDDIGSRKLSNVVAGATAPIQRDPSEDADGGTMALHVDQLLE